MHQHRLDQLLEKYQQGALQAAEWEELLALAGEDGMLAQHLQSRMENELAVDDERMNAALAKVLAVDKPAVKVLPLKRWIWAAAVIGLLSVGAWMMLNINKRETTKQVASTVPAVPPGRDGAILELADGQKIVLDSLHNGVIGSQNGVAVLLKNGQLQYEGQGEPVMNKISTPRGRQFHIVLPDGTHAWLNAASSIKYPTSFTGKERNVSITGEVYFAVTKNTTHPFKVNVDDRESIEVLGTHFNVNAYDAPIKTTLLEGSVKVNNSLLLKPGEQAINDTINHSPNIEQVIAWKNGYFNFEGVQLEDAMKQLERWYDIEVVYEKQPPSIRFVGEIEKNIPLNDMLDILQKTKVHFRLENERRLIVTQ